MSNTGNQATSVLDNDKPDSFQNNKLEIAHLDQVNSATGQLIDENLVRAENEDRVTPYFVFLISIAAVAGFLFGYDTAIVGAALPMIGSDLGAPLTDSQQEIMTAGTTIGAIFGALILGGYADKLGRKWAMAIADIAFTIGAILIASSYSLGQFIVGRIVLGFGVGAAAVIGPLYIAELAPTAVRGRCIGVNAFFIPFGQTIASALGAGFEAGVAPHIAWRVLFGLGVVPSMVQMCLLHWLPESPRVLILRNQPEKAKITLRTIYKGATEEVIDFKLRVVQQYVEATTRMQREYSFWERAKKYWTHKPYRRAIVAVSGVQAFGQLTGYNTLLYYSGTIFGLLGIKNAAAAGLIPSGGNALFLFIGMTVVDRFGRRRLMTTFIPGMMVGLLWALITFKIMCMPTGGVLVKGYEYPTGMVGSVLGSIILFTMAFGLTYSHIVWYQSEFLALEIRAAGSAIATASCWVANLVVSVAYLTQLNSMGPSGVYGLYLGFITLGYVFVYFCYPETRGLSIDETQSIFENGFGVRKAQAMLKAKQAVASELRDSSQRA